MNNTNSWSRRSFLKSTGSLAIGFSLLGGCVPTPAAEPPSSEASDKLPGSLRRTPQINAWLEVLEDGRVRVFSGKVELGQGIRIAIKQVAAEELYMDLDQVEVVLAETGRTPDEGYTAGSGSIQNSAVSVRYAAASAREKLLKLAAEKLDIPTEKLKVERGVIRVQNGTQQVSFSDVLSGEQIRDEVQMPVTLKPKSSYRFVGKAIPREDINLMVRGEPVFIQDMRFPDMVYARVLRPLNYQSKLTTFDEKGFRQVASGVLKVVRNGSFLAVITQTEYQAEKAVTLLAQYSEWSKPSIFPDQDNLRDYLRQTADPPKTVQEKGTVDLTASDRSLKASYFKPYIMHGSMGPACAISLYDQEVLHVWTHSQGIYPLRRALMAMLGMTEEQIHLISVPGAGCFGHTVADDAAADAALLAMAYPGKHVRVQWSREDEHAWEPYGSAMMMELEAGLDADGMISSWKSEIWSDSHSTRPNKQAATVLAARYLDPPFLMESRGYLGGGHRNADPYYDLPNFRINAHFFDGPLRVSSLRSLGAYANIFALESFMDELAEKAGRDPVSFRMAHLSDERAKAVLEKVQEMTSGAELAKKEGIGYAFCRYKNRAAYCAMAAQVVADPAKEFLKLRKMWAVVDVGEVINLDGIKSQTEGGMLQAASWTLKEAVTFDQYQITSRGWATYPIFRFEDLPEVEVAVIDRPDMPPIGGGEASVPPVAAAIANAIYRACGQRVYDLPIRLKGEGVNG